MSEHQNADAPIVSIRGVSKRFGSFAAVESVDLDIRRGEFFALLGPSGCGKTTLLRMLAGLELPTEGSILIDGQDMSQVPANKRPVNMVFQSYAVFPHMSVLDNVGYGLKVEGVPRAEIRERAMDALGLVKLSDFASRRPDQLSGGQRQRVALARALVKRPKVLLLDEPLSALDAKLREQMRLELVNLQEGVGITFIIVTHDQDEALSMADRIAIMNAGEVQQVAPPATLYEFPTSRFVADFIGSVNLFKGTVEDVSDGRIRMRCDGLPDPVELVQDAQADTTAPSLGTEAWAALRPEKIEVHKSEPGGEAVNRVQGVVEEITYLGEVSIYHVRIHPELPLVRALVANLDRVTRRPFTWEDKVTLSWSRDCGVVLQR